MGTAPDFGYWNWWFETEGCSSRSSPEPQVGLSRDGSHTGGTSSNDRPEITNDTVHRSRCRARMADDRAAVTVGRVDYVVLGRVIRIGCGSIGSAADREHELPRTPPNRPLDDSLSCEENDAVATREVFGVELQAQLAAGQRLVIHETDGDPPIVRSH